MRWPETLLRGALLVPVIADTQRDHAQSPPPPRVRDAAGTAYSVVRTGPSPRKGLRSWADDLFC